jgi:hypothetical protein
VSSSIWGGTYSTYLHLLLCCKTSTIHDHDHGHHSLEAIQSFYSDTAHTDDVPCVRFFKRTGPNPAPDTGWDSRIRDSRFTYYSTYLPPYLPTRNSTHSTSRQPQPPLTTNITTYTSCQSHQQHPSAYQPKHQHIEPTPVEVMVQPVVHYFSLSLLVLELCLRIYGTS